MLDKNFWIGKRVLLTGHTGFKGSWLTIWLHDLGAKVFGVSLPPNTSPNLFGLAALEKMCDSYSCDIRNESKLRKIFHNVQPDIVLHLAAQPLVRAGYRFPVETFATNIMGTTNLLEAVRNVDTVRVAVMITTDKVYRNMEHAYPYRENDALGGHDPYSASKSASEIVIASYRDSFLAEKGIAVATARAGNVVGGGDFSEDRLMPDAVRAWHNRETLEIRRPKSIRPWQHVLEPLYGYLTLAEKLWSQSNLAHAYNFGPYTHEAATVRDVIDIARLAYGFGDVTYGDGSKGPHEAGWLALEVAKARADLGVIPQWGLVETINRTVAWYKKQQQGGDALKLCRKEISEFGPSS